MTDFKGLLQTLLEHEVDFILVGGVAATVHGSTRLTQDIDIVYARSPENLDRLTAALALAQHQPYLRGAPPNLPFHWSVETLKRGLNFTLTTSLGDSISSEN
ncbi:MAG TPA: nucleotidyl transferase AbiEii/AbiGii toxin family protein [Gemmatimonadota bacterium]|nr:nucleotidyl transferase AbiEii/AbiGii toxin family protein [Gemmatimonadota bacterium]